MKNLVIISNGMGTQSKLLPILLYEKDKKLKEFWNNSIILNIFADTQDETEDTYKDLIEYQQYLKKHNYPELIIVSRGKMSDYYIEKGIIPTRKFRHCTHKFKILVIRKYIKEYLKKLEISRNEIKIKMLIGFTTEESHRMRDSDVKYIKNEFPLIYNLSYTRNDCINELSKRGLSSHKSGCWYCPFLTFKRFYTYVKEKTSEKNLIIEMEKRALLKNSKMYLFNYPIKALIRAKESQLSLDKWMDFSILESDSCDSGYCFI